MPATRYIVFVGFVLTVWAANWLITTYGIVPVGFGLAAPAGVFAVGVTFTLRDALHELAGRKWVMAAIATGAVLSAFLSPSLAVASGVAFAVSELADYSVYAPLRRRSWLAAVSLSNTVGLVVDSALFLWLAFGSLDFLTGQVVGKAYMTVAAIIVIGVGRALSVRLHRQQPA